MQARRGLFQRWGDRTASIDAELMLTAAVLGAALVVGLATASDYGLSVDEFNTDDYGPKALAWYTSGFADRSHFETVEFSLWYYGPWTAVLAGKHPHRIVDGVGDSDADRGHHHPRLSPRRDGAVRREVLGP